MNSLTVSASPSLALIKYWGKNCIKENTPATSSLAVSLEGLVTQTRLSLADRDSMSINGQVIVSERHQAFFEAARKRLNVSCHFQAVSQTNFPVDAGLASSSSGFAALAFGCAKLIDPAADLRTISELARFGSASAARAVYGGFTLLEKGALAAEPLSIHWPELRILVAVVNEAAKAVSSREAMERARLTSRYYPCWLEEAAADFPKALEALSHTDLGRLGPLIQKSFLGMFSTMLTSTPPVFYWLPETMALLRSCQTLRKEGYQIWETMDAGPQVKMFCLAQESQELVARLQQRHPGLEFLLSKPGGGAAVVS